VALSTTQDLPVARGDQEVPCFACLCRGATPFSYQEHLRDSRLNSSRLLVDLKGKMYTARDRSVRVDVPKAKQHGVNSEVLTCRIPKLFIHALSNLVAGPDK
jgi:hypothetical protein